MEIVIVIFITLILGLSICFEFGREYLRESTEEVFLPILTSLYSELTLLGFIGLLLFAIFKCDWLEELSIELFGEPGAIEDIGEEVHMVLFLVMIVFLLQAVFMGRFGEAIQRKWTVWEAKPLLTEADTASGYKEFRATYHEVTQKKPSFMKMLFKKRFSEKHNMLVHTAARLEFVKEANLKASDFDFARYLSIALGVALGELVEVPVKTWFVLEAVLLFFWRCELALSPNARIALWILTGYVTAASAYLVHAKVRLILHRYTAPLIREHHANSSAILTKQATPSFVSNEKTKTKEAQTIKLDGRRTMITNFFRSQEQNKEKTALLAQNETNLSNHDEEAGLVPKKVHHYHDLFWFGHRFHAHFTFDAIRLISLLTSVYAAIFVLVYFDDLVMYSYAAKDTSLEARSWRARGGRLGGFFIFVLAVLPPFLVIHELKSILEDFTVIANISEFKNRRYIEQVLRRQKTVAAFECLKVVQCFREPQMLEAVLAMDQHKKKEEAETIGDGSTPTERTRTPSPTEFLVNLTSSSSSPKIAKPITASRRASSIRALDQIKADDAAAYLETQRTHWHRIFDLFDDDKEGSIDREEMRTLLTKFKCDEDHINLIISVLDTDNDGIITFDEFFDFANKLTAYLEEHEDPKRLTAEMFDIIDTDASGTITVHEMHRVVAEMLGQDLSVEDVFNVIQDLDEDGNGELDLEEFTILLHRFRIYD